MSYYTETVDFKEYVKGVLPNEWLPFWEEEALRAGAIAVKQFGMVDYYQSGYVWDCNYDQVYNPTKRTPQTDKAVDDTWDLWLWHDGVVKTYYGDYPYACSTMNADCMSQYKSQELAEQGKSLRFIILTNYDGVLFRLYNKVYDKTKEN